MPININGISLSSASGTTFGIANGATEWMNVSSTGVVTRPQAPAFQAILSGQGTFYQGNPVTFGSITLNRGSHFNNSTGTFTCPVAGNYLVTMGCIASGSANGTASYGYYSILLNGATYSFSHWNHASYWEYGGVAAIVKASANDQIRFAITGAANSYVYGGGDHCSFNIVLVI